MSTHTPLVSLKILNYIYKTKKTWKGMERCTQAGEPGLREQHGKFSEVLFDPPILDLKAKMLALNMPTDTVPVESSLSSHKTRKETSQQDATLHNDNHASPVECHRKHSGPCSNLYPQRLFTSLDFCPGTAVMREVEASQCSHEGERRKLVREDK